MEKIRSRFGKHAITYGILMGDLKMPDDGRHSVKMPGMMYHKIASSCNRVQLYRKPLLTLLQANDIIISQSSNFSCE